MDGLLAAAQDHGVAALDAERRGVDRHVGPALVDHEDDAQRHAHLPDFQPVGPPARRDDLADRVGQRGHVAQRLGHLVDPPGIQRQAVDRRGVRALARARRRRRARWPPGSLLGGPRKAPADRFSQASLAARPRHGQLSRGELGLLARVRQKARVTSCVLGFDALVDYQRSCSSRILPTPHSRPDLDRVDHRRDVVHPHDPCSSQARRQRRDDRGRRALGHRAARDRAQEPLARRADQDDTSQLLKSIEVPQDLAGCARSSCRSRFPGRRRSARGECRCDYGPLDAGAPGSRRPRSRRHRSAGQPAWSRVRLACA